MPYAVINYGAPSQYAQLGQQYQNIQGDIAARNAAAAAQQAKMWYDAVSGGMGNLAQAGQTAILKNYQTRTDRENAALQQSYLLDRMRQTHAFDAGFNSWDEMQSEANRLGLNPVELQATRQAGADLIRGQATNDLALDRDRRMFEQDYTQRIQTQAADRFFQPTQIDPRVADIIKTQLPQTQRNEFYAAQKTEADLLGNLASQRPTVSPDAIAPQLAAARSTMARVMQVAQQTAPTPQQQFSASLVKDPATGVVGLRTDKGFQLVRQDELPSEVDSYKQTIGQILTSDAPVEQKVQAIEQAATLESARLKAAYKASSFVDDDGNTIQYDPKSRTFKPMRDDDPTIMRTATELLSTMLTAGKTEMVVGADGKSSPEPRRYKEDEIPGVASEAARSAKALYHAIKGQQYQQSEMPKQPVPQPASAPASQPSFTKTGPLTKEQAIQAKDMLQQKAQQQGGRLQDQADIDLLSRVVAALRGK